MATYGVQLERSDRLTLPPHRGTPDDFREWCRSLLRAGRRLAVDLYCGAGGLSLGLEQADWTVVAAVDNDPRSVETHQHNFPGRTFELDLGDRDQREEFLAELAGIDIDLVAGGPPCQPFSRAGSSKIRSLVNEGRRSPEDPRRELWRPFLDVVRRLRPRAVLMENVPDMAFADHLRLVRGIVDSLEEDGYTAQVVVMETWRYRVPQHRRRLFLLARRDNEEIRWPEEADREVTVRDAIDDLPRLGLTTGGRRLPYTPQEPISAFAAEMRAGADPEVVHDHMTRPVRDDDREIFSFMTPEMLYTDVPAHLRRYATDTFDDKYKRLAWDEKSRTITAHIAKDGYWYIHPEEPRTLTVREAARIQTFPDWFRFAGHRSDAFRQIGNAVPPLAGRAAAAALMPGTGTDSAGWRPDWQYIRTQLTAFGQNLRTSSDWFVVPGPWTTAVPAAAMAVLPPQRSMVAQIRTALSVVRGLSLLKQETFDRFLATARPRLHPSLRRLEPLVGRTVPADEVPEHLGLRPAEALLFSLLTGDDVLVPSAGALRMAARVAGTRSNEKNVLTDGRIDLARLVGAGPDAPLRMAVVRHLGMTVCTERSPACWSCPLVDACAYRRSREGADETGLGSEPVPVLL